MTDDHASLPTILVVDDEQEILVALEDLLEDSYRVLSSTSPAAALDIVADERDLAVIVSDQRMPEMPGNVFLARARTLGDAEAILLTGYADLTAVVSAVNQGAISGYAAKPWEAEALRTMVAAAAERFRLRRALRFEQAAFQGLADGSAGQVTILDAQLRQVRSNAPATASDPAEAAADRAALAGNAPTDEEVHEASDGAGERWTRIHRIPFGADGDMPHLLKIRSDETERHLAARRLQHAEKLQALGTLAGGIAHDFNNLLAAIVGNLELAERLRDQPDRLARYLANARTAADRGSAITRRLLSFSRQRDLAAATFRPDEAIREIEDLVTHTAGGRVSLRLDLASAGSVRVDPGQFELAILNLCINARDALSGGGTIVIASRDVGDAVEVTVSDTGAGIPPAMRERIFEPFFTTKPPGKGTGLGLPMVRAMAEAAGGEVGIDSVVGEGTTVRLRLPSVAIEPPLPSPESERATPAALDVLVAEDDPAVRSILVAHLEADGHRVEAVETAEAALAAFRRTGSTDLLVTDFVMPRMSGLDLIREVHALRPALPAVLVTGYAEVDDAGVDVPVLTKPFTAEQLAATIARALEEDASGSDAQGRGGGDPAG